MQVVQRYADFHGIAPNRVQRWIAFMVLGAVLSRATNEDGDHQFLIKGGVSLELRLRLGARATKDFDVAFRGETEMALRILEEAFEEPYEGFSFRRAGEVHELTHMSRLDVKVEYLGRVWASIAMEISAYEGTYAPAEEVPAMSLADFGLKGPEWLPCLPLPQQVAQKIHAMTEEFVGDRPNERFRDLWDLWVLRELVPPSPELRRVCKETFRLRGKHQWPPNVVVHEHWVEPFSVLAAEAGIAIPGVHQAADDVREYVRLIAKE
jgi:hypothetical protein